MRTHAVTQTTTAAALAQLVERARALATEHAERERAEADERARSHWQLERRALVELLDVVLGITIAPEQVGTLDGRAALRIEHGYVLVTLPMVAYGTPDERRVAGASLWFVRPCTRCWTFSGHDWTSDPTYLGERRPNHDREAALYRLGVALDQPPRVCVRCQDELRGDAATPDARPDAQLAHALVELLERHGCSIER